MGSMNSIATRLQTASYLSWPCLDQKLYDSVFILQWSLGLPWHLLHGINHAAYDMPNCAEGGHLVMNFAHTSLGLFLSTVGLNICPVTIETHSPMTTVMTVHRLSFMVAPTVVPGSVPVTIAQPAYCTWSSPFLHEDWLVYGCCSDLNSTTNTWLWGFAPNWDDEKWNVFQYKGGWSCWWTCSIIND